MTLVLQAVGPRVRRVLELFSLAIAVLLALLFAWYCVHLSIESYGYHDVVRPANDADAAVVPADRDGGRHDRPSRSRSSTSFVLEALGRRVVVASDEMLHNE